MNCRKNCKKLCSDRFSLDLKIFQFRIEQNCSAFNFNWVVNIICPTYLFFAMPTLEMISKLGRGWGWPFRSLSGPLLGTVGWSSLGASWPPTSASTSHISPRHNSAPSEDDLKQNKKPVETQKRGDTSSFAAIRTLSKDDMRQHKL